MKLEGLALDVGSILLDSLRDRPKAEKTAERLRQNIRAAGEAGIPMVKYTVAMVAITRTGVTDGRGGMKCSTFEAARYAPEADAAFSYWGTVLPEDGAGGAHTPKALMKTAEAGGQVMAAEAGGITEAEGWEAIEFLVNAILPTATEAGVRLACHPHDPAYPPGGLNGVHHVLGSLDGLRRFLDLAPGNPFHGNFCQGTIAEMSKDPNAVVLEAIREFGPQKKIFMVHFRNIMGGYLDFREAMPDEAPSTWRQPSGLPQSVTTACSAPTTCRCRTSTPAANASSPSASATPAGSCRRREVASDRRHGPAPSIGLARRHARRRVPSRACCV